VLPWSLSDARDVVRDVTRKQADLVPDDGSVHD
jgi:hypothetical protein